MKNIFITRSVVGLESQVNTTGQNPGLRQRQNWVTTSFFNENLYYLLKYKHVQLMLISIAVQVR